MGVYNTNFPPRTGAASVRMYFRGTHCKYLSRISRFLDLHKTRHCLYLPAKLRLSCFQLPDSWTARRGGRGAIPMMDLTFGGRMAICMISMQV